MTFFKINFIPNAEKMSRNTEGSGNTKGLAASWGQELSEDGGSGRQHFLTHKNVQVQAGIFQIQLQKLIH